MKYNLKLKLKKNKPAPANFSRTEGSFQFSGPNIWNDVPYEIRCLTDIEVFKKSLKTYYFLLMMLK